ncbi:hypothetical protein [Terrimonas pollutisoli]|uniref:hypothetical protein n=1 Tax=Terrimonas pollutisoli TaxID=3034147 RepID=UPI0023EB5AA0|nr:hypothetical protein [Terrimonas sp. H1YJ31]
MGGSNNKIRKITLEKRKEDFKKKNTGKPLLDLRLYFTYDLPKPLWYLLSFSDIVLEFLQKKRFHCPGYSHIYISIGETKREALKRAFELEKWYRFGIAVLPLKKLLGASEEEKEQLFLKAIADGLLDVVKRDGLEISTIRAAITHAKKRGVLQETTINQRQNSKYQFRITNLPIKNKTGSDIYFSLLDKAEQKEYKWRFGRLSSLEAYWWFFNITVTNKEIRTKPKANMELVLKGKKNRLKLSVEKIKKGIDRITISKTRVPVPAWLAKLDKL